jgi:hypothetical protein
MTKQFSTTELEAFLDEALPAARMAAIEEAARSDEGLVKQLAAVNGRRDAGVHGLGEIWRRRRLSCPTREELGSYLLGVLGKDHAEYVTFHLEVVECRYCTANVEDLRSQQSSAAGEASARRRRYFQSSAGYLGKDEG